MRKMLPKSHHCTNVGYDKGVKSVKYYNAETRSILTSRNYKFLIPSNFLPPKILLIDPEPKDTPIEGEHEGDTCKEQQIEADNDLDNDQPIQTNEQQEGLTRPSRHPRMDYRYLNDPFPDEEEAEMAYVVK